jgi:hypothetical protein
MGDLGERGTLWDLGDEIQAAIDNAVTWVTTSVTDGIEDVVGITKYINWMHTK